MFSRDLFFAVGLLTILRYVNPQCSSHETLTFSRWSGVSPERPAPVFVYTARGDEPSLTGACLARCRDLAECSAVTLVHGKGHCYGVAASSNTVLRIDNDVTYFEKLCLQLPSPCGARWWSLESTPGYHLQAEGLSLKVILNSTIQECYAAVLAFSNDKLNYRSAQWVASGEEIDQDVINKSNSVTGNCILNTENKFTAPESFRVSNYHAFYIENQCVHDYPKKIDRCSYEEYYNQTLKHIEYTVNLKTKDECKSSCELEERFVCRGFTWRQPDSSVSSPGECSLHSEDLLTIGSWLMRRASNSNYYRRVICLNITVECSTSEMRIEYRPRGKFRGRVYVPGRGDECAARTLGGRLRLVLPLQGRCDVQFAHAVSASPGGLLNRTMAYVMVMIQNNAIIQTAGDRWVRVGCSPPVASPQQVHATIAITQHTKPSLLESNSAGASAVFNNSWSSTSSSLTSPLTMYIVRADGSDADGRDYTPNVALGEELELRIETTEQTEIEVYHLVASSRLGDSSVLLLDSRGCPTGQVDFPGFTRSWFGDVQRLWVKFKAFRFPTSNIVRFAVMVRFCESHCLPRSCGKGRIAREVNETGGSTGGVVAQSGAGCGAGGVGGSAGGVGGGVGGAGGAVPLELELVVGARPAAADTLVRADQRASIAEDVTLSAGGRLGGEDVVCMHETLVVALALCWLAVQLLLLLGCCLMLKRYRNLAEMNMQKDYQCFDNVGFDSLSTHRRVHWPDQNVDILHVN